MSTEKRDRLKAFIAAEERRLEAEWDAFVLTSDDRVFTPEDGKLDDAVEELAAIEADERRDAELAADRAFDNSRFNV